MLPLFVSLAYPVAKKLHKLGADVTVIAGFKNKDLVILEKEFEGASTKVFKMSDDGSWGRKGLVTEVLKELIESGENYDEVIAIAQGGKK